MKVAVIGGGSTYTPELVSGFLARIEKLPVTELWLMDIDEKRLAVVGGFARRMVEAKGSPFQVHLTGNQREAIRGASYVITQLRVGQMEARREDEYLGKRHGLIGQETTGIGGMAKALRTIPIILKIAEDIREEAPKALLANFTNPSGLVTQALVKYAPDVQAVGVCNVPITAKMDLLGRLEKLMGGKIDPQRVELMTLGLNHLSWHRGFLLDGEDMWGRIFPEYVSELKAEAEPEWDTRTIETLGMIPNYYLQYYYYTKRKVADQQNWPPSRAEEVMDVEKELLGLYADPTLIEPPDSLMKRGGAYYSTMATQLLDAHFNDRGETHVANVAHRGAVAGWNADWVLEMPCRVDKKGVHPIPVEPLPTVCYGLLAQVKAYELLTVEAAVHGDRSAAYQALMAHPLGPQADQVQSVLEDLLRTHRAHLPQFWE
jgi:6-phospho-beta-glucosidase